MLGEGVRSAQQPEATQPEAQAPTISGHAKAFPQPDPFP
jgi:hypothetical protein